jgi:hypothetical protein
MKLLRSSLKWDLLGRWSSGRNTNSAPHELARNCFDTNSSCIWVDGPPIFMLQFLFNDVTVIELGAASFLRIFFLTRVSKGDWKVFNEAACLRNILYFKKKKK